VPLASMVQRFVAHQSQKEDEEDEEDAGSSIS
jgi:hypothetical protein